MIKNNTDNIKYVYGNLENIYKWEKILEEVEIVIHLAAPVVFWGEWDMYERLVVKATKDLIFYANKNKVKRFIYISSESVLQDKEDLLNYCWYVIIQKIEVENHINLSPEEAIKIFFEKTYDIFYINKEYVKKLVRHNGKNSQMITSFESYVKVNMLKIFEECVNINTKNIPRDIVSEHYCNTIFFLIDYIFIRNNNISKETSLEYLRKMLSPFLD